MKLVNPKQTTTFLLMTRSGQARGQPGDNTACPILLRPLPEGESGTFELVAGNAQATWGGAENLEGDEILSTSRLISPET